MWYWLFRFITVVLLKVCFRFRVEGAQNIPKKTNFIVVANHTSYLDPFIVGAGIPQRIYWLAIRDLYRVFGIRWFMHKTQTLPVGNASGKLVYLLMDGKNVGLFPEGTRTHDGRLRDFRRGAAVLSHKTGRPIVPCAIIGAYEAFPPAAGFPRFSAITLKIGRPVYLLKEFDELIDDVFLQEGTIRVRNTIKEMIYA